MTTDFDVYENTLLYMKIDCFKESKHNILFTTLTFEHTTLTYRRLN